MYINYFGLKEKPFSIAPDPRYLYMSELHREALAHLLYGISGDGCFILLTGDVGTGKTTVCRCLLAQLPENTDVALIVNPRLSVLELLEAICDELQISTDGVEKSLKAYIDILNVYLLDAHAQGRNVALLIDEAQNLSLDLLEQLRLLTNLETDQKKLLKIVLLGQTELRLALQQQGAAQISQRITSRYHLLPLDQDNSLAYIRHRLTVAGEREDIFSQAALVRVFEYSAGIPRLINVICDRAMLGTYVEENYLVSSEVVDKAAVEVLGDGAAKNIVHKQRWLKLIVATLLIFAGIAGVSYYFSEQIGGAAKLVTGIEESADLPLEAVHEEIVPEREEPQEAPLEEETVDEAEDDDNTEPETTLRMNPLEINE